MGLKELFSRWTKSEDDRAREQVEEGLDREDYEARKDDVKIGESFAGSEAAETADDDLHAG